MNYLLSYGACGLGDLISTTLFLKDFHDQYPHDKLYFYFEYQQFEKYLSIFDNNPYFHYYSGGFTVDKVFHFGWGEKENILPSKKCDEGNTGLYIDTLYVQFKEKYGIEVKRSAAKADIYLNEQEKKNVINSDKPICLFNNGYNAMLGNSRNWGISNFHTVISALKDKVNFVQVGTTGGYFNFPMANSLNLIDKTNIRTLLTLINQSRFILTHDSSLFHMASFDSDTKRTIIPIVGARTPYTWLNCYAPKNVDYAFMVNHDKFKKCFPEGKCTCDCCTCGSNYYFQTKFNSDGHFLTPICKSPIVDTFGVFIPECFVDIKAEDVVNIFKDRLNTDN